MTAGTDALYQELILDHNRKPKNFRVMEHADREVLGHNPLCGDQLTLWVKLDGDRQVLTVIDASRVGQGAAAILGNIPAGAFPRELRATADGRTLLLTNYASRTLEIIDLTRLPLQR